MNRPSKNTRPTNATDLSFICGLLPFVLLCPFVFLPGCQRSVPGNSPNSLPTISLPKKFQLPHGYSNKPALWLPGHSNDTWAVAFSPDGNLIATGSRDSSVMLWDAATGKERSTLYPKAGPVSGLSFSPDGKLLAIANDHSKVQVWDLTTETTTLEMRTTEGFKDVSFSPDGNSIAAAGDLFSPTIWDAKTGKQILNFKVPNNLGMFRVAVFSPDGARIANSGDSTLTISDSRTGLNLLSLKGHTAFVSSAAFSPDGQRVATGSEDQTVKVWNAFDGQELFSIPHEHRVNDVAFSPDGRRIASASSTGWAKVFDAADGKDQFTFGHGRSVYAVAFSPDGRRLASAGEAETKIWELKQESQ